MKSLITGLQITENSSMKKDKGNIFSIILHFF